MEVRSVAESYESQVTSRSSRLLPLTRLVLLCLARYSNSSDDPVRPSLFALSDETGLALETVRKHLKIAEAAGWISSSIEKDSYGDMARHYRKGIPGRLAELSRGAV